MDFSYRELPEGHRRFSKRETNGAHEDQLCNAACKQRRSPTRRYQLLQTHNAVNIDTNGQRGPQIQTRNVTDLNICYPCSLHPSPRTSMSRRGAPLISIPSCLTLPAEDFFEMLLCCSSGVKVDGERSVAAALSTKGRRGLCNGMSSGITIQTPRIHARMRSSDSNHTPAFDYMPVYRHAGLPLAFAFVSNIGEPFCKLNSLGTTVRNH